MRVAQIITGLGVGGAERLVLQLASDLNSRGTKTEVISIASRTGMVELTGYNSSLPFEFPLDIGNFAQRLSRLASLLLLVRRSRFDVIHCHMVHSMLVGVALKVLNPSIKLVFTSHSGVPKKRVYGLLTRWTRAFRDADVIFYKGQHPALNSRRSIVIPNGVALSVRPVREEFHGATKRFLHVGRFEPVKDQPGLVDAFADAELRDWELWLAGAGPLEGAARDRAAARGVSDRVKFLGIRDDVRNLMGESEALLIYSNFEGMPMVALEAGAEGLTIISTPVGAMPGLLSEDRGIIASKESFAAALKTFADAGNPRRKWGTRLQEYVRGHLSSESVAAQHLSLYQALVDPGPRERAQQSE